MRNVLRFLCVGFIASCMSAALPNDASAQYPVAVQPVVPAVVGYTAERRGLFGRRIVYRPVVAPAAAAVPVTAARVQVGYAPAVAPVTSYYAPAAPVTSYYAPAAPVTSYYAPPAPVTSYYAPAAPVAVPITTYRVPVPAYVPLIGF